MLSIKEMNTFRRDVKRAAKRGKDLRKLQAIVVELMNERPLEPKYNDHPLHGNYKGARECHIEPDWLLIYIVKEHDLTLVRTGTHPDLFR